MDPPVVEPAPVQEEERERPRPVAREVRLVGAPAHRIREGLVASQVATEDTAEEAVEDSSAVAGVELDS